MIYHFPESGSIPGIAGLFAGVRVDVHADGSYTTTPLAQHAHVDKSASTEAIVESSVDPMDISEAKAPKKKREVQ